MPIIDCYALTGSWPQSEVDLSVEAIISGMQARGVARSLVTHTSAIFYEPTPANEQIAQICAEQPSLIPVGVINPLDYPHCLEEVSRCMERGIQVFRLCPREHGYPISGAVGPLRAALRRLEQARLLLVDVADLPAPVIAAEVEELLPVPTAFTVDGLGLGTVLHSGKLGPNVWVETSRLDMGGALEAAVKHLGAARVVFGSGAPLHSLGSAVMSLQYAEIPEPDRAAIFEGNVLRALGP